jgi:ABC-type polysaccharide transport system permease subunit
MLNGYKPWQKIIFENFLMILSLMVIVLIRIIGKFMKPDFGVYNLLALVLATIGFLLLSFSKREQLKMT